MNRINVNIKCDITEEEAMWYVLKASKEFGSENDRGVVTFYNDVKVSYSKTESGNSSYTILK